MLQVLGGLILAFNFLLAATPLVSLKAANYKWPLWLAVGYPLLSAGALVRVCTYAPQHPMQCHCACSHPFSPSQEPKLPCPFMRGIQRIAWLSPFGDIRAWKSVPWL